MKNFAKLHKGDEAIQPRYIGTVPARQHVTQPAPMHGVWYGPIQICSFGSMSRVIVPGMAHMIHAVENKIQRPTWKTKQQDCRLQRGRAEGVVRHRAETKDTSILTARQQYCLSLPRNINVGFQLPSLMKLLDHQGPRSSTLCRMSGMHLSAMCESLQTFWEAAEARPASV